METHQLNAAPNAEMAKLQRNATWKHSNPMLSNTTWKYINNTAMNEIWKVSTEDSAQRKMEACKTM